jgi:hypothetical protein
VLFAGGSEVAVIDPPRLLEVADVERAASLAHLLDVIGPGALVRAEEGQASKGATNPRFTAAYAEPAPATAPGTGAAPTVRSCVLVTDRPDLSPAVVAGLAARGTTCRLLDAGSRATFDAAAGALAADIERHGAVEGVIVALSGDAASVGATTEWERILAEHRDLVAAINTDAAWTRAVADLATQAPVRLVTLTDATTAGGRSRAQAVAQLARSARGATDDRVLAFPIAVEASGASLGSAGELAAALLLGGPELAALSGGELVAGAGWVGVRSHPQPGTSIVMGGADVPPWLDRTLREIIGADRTRGTEREEVSS